MTGSKSIMIVGASLAGVKAAETLPAQGFDGRVSLIGEEPEQIDCHQLLREPGEPGGLTRLWRWARGSDGTTTGRERIRTDRPWS